MVRVGAVIFLVCLPQRAVAQVFVRAWFPAGEASDIVGFRYKTRILENPTALKIIFGFSRLSGNGAQAAPYFFETNLYTDRWTYPDGTCTIWPLTGQHFDGQASIRLALADYVRAGHTGVKTFAPAMFPRQTYEIDGIDGLWKTDGISQQALTSVEVGVEVTLGEIVTDRSGWKCSGSLDNSTYRQWNAEATFSGATYRMAFAVLDELGRYAFPGEVMNFDTEFFEYPGVIRALVWDAEILREGSPYWIRVNRWRVTQRSDKPAGTYGVRITSNGGEPAIEIANDNSGPYAAWDSTLDLGVAPAGQQAPDLVADPVVVTGGPGLIPGRTLPVSVTVRNIATVASGPFQIGFGFGQGAVPSVFSDRMSPTTCYVAAGLTPGQAFTCAVPVVVPTGSGSFRFNAFADPLGAVVETDKSNNTSTAAGAFDLIPCPLPSNWSLPEDFTQTGLTFESMARDGLSRTQLQYRASLDVTNGDIRSVGPGYVDAQDFIPYMMRDTNTATLLAHPGQTKDAAVGIPICTPGRYRIQGAFARANDFRNAGDGVAVRVVRGTGTNAGDILFSGAISSGHDVPPDYFSGTGVATFDLWQDLLAGDVVRFVVSSGTAQDASFDATALKATLASGATSFFTASPCRVADTRNPVGPSGGPALSANSVRTFPVTGLCGIPSTAKAVAVNLAVFLPSNDGDLRVFSAGAPAPLASLINFRPGIVRANNAIVPLGAGGQISIQCDMPPGSADGTHFFFDVYGYFQ